MLNIYLTFDGNTREAFDFYASVFDSQISILNTFGDGPPDMTVADEHKNKIMHVSLPIGPSTLMASDHVPGFGPPLSVGNNFSISIDPGDRERTDALFAKLSEGGEASMEPQDTFWGAYFAMCRDKFGINWMLNHDTQNR